jgi:hypothetical protein
MRIRPMAMSALCLAAVAASSAAFAGVNDNPFNGVSFTQHGSTIYIGGSVAAARYSADGSQWIGCSIYGSGLLYCGGQTSPARVGAARPPMPAC